MTEVFSMQGIQSFPDNDLAFPRRKQFTNYVKTFGLYADDSVFDAVVLRRVAEQI